MPEEAVLLVEDGHAVFVDDPRAYPDPTVAQLREWDEEEQRNIAQQLISLEGRSTSGPNQPLSDEAIRKRKEREERKAAQLTSAAQDDPLVVSALSNATSGDNLESPAPPSRPNPRASTAPYSVVIPAKSEAMSWYTPDSVTYTTVEAAKSAGIWSYPSNLEERARCGVFRGLWSREYYLGSGIKFGGEYLVYPGDPLRYHSHFVATVIPSRDSGLWPMEIVAHGRLGTATKKTHLMCAWDDVKKEASFLSIEWAGFG
ncbi:hypothetical protein AX16_004185 [Volvariella volvacea WC 439]|nr:hypothetical protein AX16_004185 [Volvariella volvacea WC 439]